MLLLRCGRPLTTRIGAAPRYRSGPTKSDGLATGQDSDGYEKSSRYKARKSRGVRRREGYAAGGLFAKPSRFDRQPILGQDILSTLNL